MNKPRQTDLLNIWFMLALLLSSCMPMPAQVILQVQHSTMQFPTTTFTATPQPTVTPTVQPTTLPMDEPLFYDPLGWYSLKIPRGWKSTGNPGSFKGDDGFMETGYLSEQRFMPTSMDICQWQANIVTKQIY